MVKVINVNSVNKKYNYIYETKGVASSVVRPTCYHVDYNYPMTNLYNYTCFVLKNILDLTL